MSTETLIEHGLYIAGATEPLAGDHARSSTPAPASSSGRVTSATAEDADRAVRAAHDAQREWGRLGYAERGKVIHACAEAFEAHVDELAPILVAEQGKTIREAKIELHKAADTLEHYAGLSRQVRGISVHNSTPASTGACCAARSASWPRSCRGTSRRRCCATSSARRGWPATRSWPSRPTRRR